MATSTERKDKPALGLGNGARRRLVVHCGSSKNGSTAIQSVLLSGAGKLAQQGVGVLVLSHPRDRLFSELNLDECGVHAGHEVVSDVSRSLTASFGALYEIYRRQREQRDVTAFRTLEAQVRNRIDAMLERFDTVVVSAEAFEISLCLRDGLFRGMVRRLARRHEVHLIFYRPDAAEHALRSWTQWGWIEHYQYSNWVRSYLQKIDGRVFFSRPGQSYWGNLVDVGCWLDYWKHGGGLSLKVYSGAKDTCRHFFGKILDVPLDEEIGRLSSQERNLGWPKTFILSFPLFFKFIAGKFEKYETLRQTLLDKIACSKDRDVKEYRELLKLTRIALASIGTMSERRASTISTDELEIVFRWIDDQFVRISSSEIAEVYGILADTMYFNHVTRLGSLIPEPPDNSEGNSPRTLSLQKDNSCDLM